MEGSIHDIITLVKNVNKRLSKGFSPNMARALIINQIKAFNIEVQKYLSSNNVTSKEKLEFIRVNLNLTQDLYNEVVSMDLQLENEVNHLASLLRIRIFSSGVLTDKEQAEGLASILADLLTNSQYIDKIPYISPEDYERLRTVFNSLATNGTQYFLAADRLVTLSKENYKEWIQKAIYHYSLIFELQHKSYNYRRLFDSIYENMQVTMENFIRSVISFMSIYDQVIYLLKSLLYRGMFDEDSINLTPFGFKEQYSSLELILFLKEFTLKPQKFLDEVLLGLKGSPYFHGTDTMILENPSIIRLLKFAELNYLIAEHYEDISSMVMDVSAKQKIENRLEFTRSWLESFYNEKELDDLNEFDVERHIVFLGELGMMILEDSALLVLYDDYGIEYFNAMYYNVADAIEKNISTYLQKDYTLYARVLIAYGLRNNNSMYIRQGKKLLASELPHFEFRLLDVFCVRLQILQLNFSLGEMESYHFVEQLKKLYDEFKGKLPGGENGTIEQDIRMYINLLEDSIVKGIKVDYSYFEDRLNYFNPTDSYTWITFDFKNKGGEQKKLKYIPFCFVKDSLF